MTATLFLTTTVVLTLIAVTGAAWVLFTYNELVRRRNAVENAFASTDVAARKRYDLIPNLVACVRGYVDHEREVLTEIIELRRRAEMPALPKAARLDIANRMTGILGDFMLLAEDYPSLKSDTHFLHLQRSLVELEEQLSAARRFFNTAVTRYNDAVQSMPASLIAARLGFDGAEWFQATETERAVREIAGTPLEAVPERISKETTP
jgi:LemA protein